MKVDEPGPVDAEWSDDCGKVIAQYFAESAMRGSATVTLGADHDPTTVRAATARNLAEWILATVPEPPPDA